ncbi:MAG: hypothetical protein ABI288_04070 [Ginsengibacter sp.]
MKNISIWAHAHKVAARIAIVLIYILLNISGLIVGDILYSMDINLPHWILILACIFTVVGAFLYPLKKHRHRYLNFYKSQKLFDGLLVFATFIFIVFTGNQINNKHEPFIGRSFASNIIPRSLSETSLNISTGKSLGENSLSKKEQKRSFKMWIKSLRKSYKAQDNSGKTLRIILVVLGAIGLSLVLTALACNIACSGAEALGYIVGIGGIAAVIFGAVKLIQRITRGKPEKLMDTSPSQ